MRIKIQTSLMPILFCCITTVLFLIPFSHLPNTYAAEDTTPPTISVPLNVYSKNNDVTISGNVVDDISASTGLTLKIYEFPDQPVILQTDTDGNWSYTTNLSDGNHTLTIEATDEASNTSKVSINVIVDKLRPMVTAVNVTALNQLTNSPEQVDLLTFGDLTRVKLESEIIVTVKDNYTINNPNLDSITVFSKRGTVTGTSVFLNDTQQFKFTPSSNLAPSTTYYAIINSKLVDPSNSGSDFTDNAGNSIYPRIVKFTTTGTSGTEDPHGKYSANVSTCANCHNTHVSSGPKLDQPQNIPPSADNYCMACHDGTAAPLPENMDLQNGYKHDYQLDPNHLSKAGSCTQCHNPHLTWSKENANLLKDHYVYQHTNSAIGLKDSQTELCEKCHDGDTHTVKDSTGVNYKIFKYNNAATATGLSDDYDACLKCHNSEKSGIKDVKTFYSDPASMHRISAIDGSRLSANPSGSDGHLPCSECHETHGSKNIDQLKEKLGHENQIDAFSATTGDWNAERERQFCTRCHNGSTAIYGVTGKALDITKSAGHDPSTDKGKQACATCHSNSYDPTLPTQSLSGAFLEAAHAPKKGVDK